MSNDQSDTTMRDTSLNQDQTAVDAIRELHSEFNLLNQQMPGLLQTLQRSPATVQAISGAIQQRLEEIQAKLTKIQNHVPAAIETQKALDKDNEELEGLRKELAKANSLAVTAASAAFAAQESLSQAEKQRDSVQTSLKAETVRADEAVTALQNTQKELRDVKLSNSWLREVLLERDQLAGWKDVQAFAKIHAENAQLQAVRTAHATEGEKLRAELAEVKAELATVRAQAPSR